MTGAHAQGMPSAAFPRDDPKSDAAQAVLANPWFYAATTQGPLDKIQVPWQCRGSLLYSLLSVALCTGPQIHKTMPLAERAENAACGFVLWDLWSLLSARMEAQQGALAGSMAMAVETVHHLPDICLNMLAISASKPESWRPKHCPTFAIHVPSCSHFKVSTPIYSCIF